VSGITPGSPAERAGVQAGDILLELDGRAIADLRSYSAILRELAPGQKVAVVLRRGDAERTLEVTLAER
jgi:S1-C subfamily serine protease